MPKLPLFIPIPFAFLLVIYKFISMFVDELLNCFAFLWESILICVSTKIWVARNYNCLMQFSGLVMDHRLPNQNAVFVEKSVSVSTIFHTHFIDLANMTRSISKRWHGINSEAHFLSNFANCAYICAPNDWLKLKRFWIWQKNSNASKSYSYEI